MLLKSEIGDGNKNALTPENVAVAKYTLLRQQEGVNVVHRQIQSVDIYHLHLTFYINKQAILKFRSVFM